MSIIDSLRKVGGFTNLEDDSETPHPAILMTLIDSARKGAFEQLSAGDRAQTLSHMRTQTDERSAREKVRLSRKSIIGSAERVQCAIGARIMRNPNVIAYVPARSDNDILHALHTIHAAYVSLDRPHSSFDRHGSSLERTYMSDRTSARDYLRGIIGGNTLTDVARHAHICEKKAISSAGSMRIIEEVAHNDADYITDLVQSEFEAAH